MTCIDHVAARPAHQIKPSNSCKRPTTQILMQGDQARRRLFPVHLSRARLCVPLRGCFEIDAFRVVAGLDVKITAKL